MTVTAFAVVFNPLIPMTQPSAPKHFQCPALVLTLTSTQILGDDMAEELREQLMSVCAQCHAQNVILNFENVKYLSSAGFRPLLSLHKVLRQVHGRLIFCQLTPEVHEIFEVTRLISTKGNTPAPFDVYPSIAGAVESIQAK